jgi:LacI family transcriptional regulator
MPHPIPPRRATLSEVAAQAGVSRATVSLVLRDSPLVAAGTRARMQAAAEAVGYLYNRGAATMRGRRTQTIGLLVTEIDNPFFAEMTAGAEAALDAAGHVVFLATTGDSAERQGRVLRRLREHRVDGLILFPALGTGAGEIAELARLGMPCVQAMRQVPHSAGDFTGPANRQGMEALARHLIATGCRRFAFAGAGVMHSGVRERLEGLRAMLRRQDLPPPEVLKTPGTRDGGMEAARHVLALAPRPDALVCGNDVVAFGAMPVLEQAGLRIGIDIAVTGVVDVPEAAICRPPLTTLQTEPRRTREAAAGLLLRRIAQPMAAARRMILPARLTVRASCGAGAIPPAAA